MLYDVESGTRPVRVGVGQPGPPFDLSCVSATRPTPRPIVLDDYAGRWLILIFYPRDFSFVCPTELTAFSARVADFGRRDCELLGISVDSIELHQEWLTTAVADGGLGPLQFPLASDPHGAASRAYGVWVAEKQVSTRGLFIIDPGGVLQYAVVHNLSVGRSADEVLRVLDALRNGGLCPASWTLADGTIDAESALKSGRILGHYRIREQLGDGTFGTVFAAWDLRLERMVALKILKRNVIESRDALLKEARAAAKLNHANVCTVFAIDEEDGLPVIVMEHLDGRPLSELTEGGVAPVEAEKITLQIASGLAAAHEENIVHGDLKPANIMVTEQGMPKILDFGLARSQRTTTSSDDIGKDAAVPDAMLAASGAPDDLAGTVDHVPSPANQAETRSASADGIHGTPAYMSPEQAAGRSSTVATDVFALGLVFFEMLTGRRALADESLPLILRRLSDNNLGADLASQVDPKYRSLLAVMLARAADDRPTMIDVVNHLRQN